MSNGCVFIWDKYQSKLIIDKPKFLSVGFIRILFSFWNYSIRLRVVKSVFLSSDFSTVFANSTNALFIGFNISCSSCKDLGGFQVDVGLNLISAGRSLGGVPW